MNQETSGGLECRQWYVVSRWFDLLRTGFCSADVVNMSIWILLCPPVNGFGSFLATLHCPYEAMVAFVRECENMISKSHLLWDLHKKGRKCRRSWVMAIRSERFFKRLDSVLLWCFIQTKGCHMGWQRPSQVIDSRTGGMSIVLSSMTVSENKNCAFPKPLVYCNYDKHRFGEQKKRGSTSI